VGFVSLQFIQRLSQLQHYSHGVEGEILLLMLLLLLRIGAFCRKCRPQDCFAYHSRQCRLGFKGLMAAVAAEKVARYKFQAASPPSEAQRLVR